MAWNDIICDCGRDTYNPDRYDSCYECFLDRCEGYLVCVLCGVRWHAEIYDCCYTCRWKHPSRQEAARALRLAILMRDEFKCRECGSRSDPQIDHIWSCASGGTADPWNLQVLCGTCNRDKGSTWWASTTCKWYRLYQQQLADYFIGLRGYLEPDEQVRLVDAVNYWRQQNGFETPVRWSPQVTDKAASGPEAAA